MGLAVVSLVLLGFATSAWAAGDVRAQRGSDQAIEVIVVKAKRAAPESIDVVIVTARRTAVSVEPRTPPTMPIEIPRLEFVVAAPPVVRL
jgi:hypothetical protein